MILLKQLTAFHWRCAAILVIAAWLVASPWAPFGQGEIGAEVDDEWSVFGVRASHALLVGGAPGWPSFD
jgi:hypothetical protein